MKYLSSQKNRGFTVVELLVSLSIIGILSTIVFTNFSQARKRARIARRVSDMKQVQVALEYYYTVNKVYPSTGGSANWRSECSAWGGYTASNVIPGLVPVYLASMPTDPLVDKAGSKNCYLYTSDGTNYAFRIDSVTEFTSADYLSRSELVDPFRDGVANTVVDGTAPTAWKVYSAGAVGW